MQDQDVQDAEQQFSPSCTYERWLEELVPREIVEQVARSYGVQRGDESQPPHRVGHFVAIDDYLGGMGVMQPCPDCDGVGLDKADENPCARCGGDGFLYPV